MAKKAKISVLGPIGSFTLMENGKPKKINGVKLIDIVSKVESLDEEVTDLTVEVGSLGGNVQVAKQIRGFLKSIQPRIKVTTVQVDDLASAGTIIFTSGSERVIAKGINPNTNKKFQNMVHSPWIPHFEGNADEMEAEMKAMRITEDEMADMYVEDCGMKKESIMPLMKAETFFDDVQALEIKFATSSYEALNQAAYLNLTNMEKKTDKKSWIKELVAALKGEALAEDAGTPNPLMGKAVLINGTTPPDSVYSVKGGVVTAVEPLAEEAAEDAPAAAAAVKKPIVAAAEKALTAEAVATLIANEREAGEKKLNETIVALKKQIKGEHVPVAFDPTTKDDLVAEWNKLKKEGKHLGVKKSDPEKFDKMFFAVYGKMPN